MSSSLYGILALIGLGSLASIGSSLLWFISKHHTEKVYQKAADFIWLVFCPVHRIVMFKL